MIKNEKMVSDMELDMVVGGASALFLRKREDGKIDGVLTAANGDVKELERLMSGGEVSKIKASATLKVATIRGDKLNDFIELQKKNNPDLEIKWVE